MIRVTTLLAVLALLALPGIASAQSSFFGMLTCDAESAQRGAVDKPSATDGDAAVKGNAGAKNGPGGKNGGGFKKGNGSRNGAGGNGGSATNTNSSTGSVATGSLQSGAAAVVAQEKCSWTLPVQIGSDTATDGLSAFNLNITGSRSSDTGSLTSNTNNSDQFTLSFTGTSVLDGGETRSRQGTWKFTNGTGTLKGITGTGTYTAIARAAGGMSYDLEGAYVLPGMIPTRVAPLGTPMPDSSATPQKPVS